MADSPTPAPSLSKSSFWLTAGVASSEFKVFVLGVLFVFFSNKLGIQLTPDQQTDLLKYLGIGYMASRGIAKATTNS